ncbi:MAG: serine/threonine-protein kinase [bacterium]|nr:serine/threonine-protein kinase [bacterium]
MRIGSFDVIRQISEGSFGRTYLGQHARLQESACIKQEKTGTPEFMRLFRDEAALLWRLHHVSLPAMRDYVEESDVGQCIVMSFIEGANLEDIVTRDGPIDDEHLCWILQRTLDALSYLHHLGIVHCDVKPQNVILDIPEHNAVLVDFGLSAVAPTAQTKSKGGTRFFLPPEFLIGRPPLPASDLYSLGMTAVFITGGNVATGVLPKDMRPELRTFIETMIRQDPLARPQDARQLNQNLTALRRSVFGRTATREAFKHRNKKGATP